LWLGTRAENNADARKKGRTSRRGHRLAPELKRPTGVEIQELHMSWLKIQAIRRGMDKQDGLFVATSKILAGLIDAAMKVEP